MTDHGDNRNGAPERPAAAVAAASPSVLDGARADASLSAHDVLLFLRNPGVSPARIQRISGNPVWMKSYRVRTAIVQHPRTPRPVAMGLLSSLRWADLARVASASRLPMPLRISAEKILLLRLPELALGEKISLARIATSPVIRAMRAETSPLVARALLDNAALRFEEALFMAERPDAPEAFLRALAGSARFAGRPEMRRALAAHPRTPRAVALRLVSGLEPTDLASLAASDAVPILVRVAAERRLDPRAAAPSVVRT